MPITGQNAKRVLFGALNPLTGHRIVPQRPSLRQEDFQAFPRLLRAHSPGRPLFLLLDKAGCHTAARSPQLAARLGIHLLWLPKQGSELNARAPCGAASSSTLPPTANTPPLTHRPRTPKTGC